MLITWDGRQKAQALRTIRDVAAENDRQSRNST
jgi:hypothetical protein